MTLAPNEAYYDKRPYELVVFDVRIPGVPACLHRERAAWGGCGDIEALDEIHYVLLVRPGGAHGD